MDIDTSGWSGDGDFTIELVEILKGFDEIQLMKVEDAPASRSGTGYNFLANEIFLTFAIEPRPVAGRLFGLIPVTRREWRPRLTLAELESRLSAIEGVGAPDYSDEAMLQYLRTQRVVPPYQTRGYKLVEMVRLYVAAPATPSADAGR